MASAKVGEGDTPVPTTENNRDDGNAPPAKSSESRVTDQQWQAMQDLLLTVYDHRTADGYDPSKIFHRKVNKRFIPNYYDVIKEPMALSTIKQKLNAREYDNFKDFVRDFALIPHNAQVFNRADALAYQDALEIKRLLEQELKKIADSKVASEEEIVLPYLGEIPPQEDGPSPDAQEEDDDDEDDEEDDEGEESDDSSKVKKKRGPGRPKGTTGIPKRDAAQREEARLADLEAKKKRGRPPRVDTPMESRIKNILKSLRRYKDNEGDARIRHFDRLPDRTVMPEYFNEIKSPMAVDAVKKKIKRKKYQSVEQFMADIDQMFENAKLYNQDESQINKDAVFLQKEAHKLAQEENQRPDSDFAMEDGRLPLPGGIGHNGQIWKVGDWVHLQNPNDLTKPIPAQIYRTWQDGNGSKFVNTCWYYRPEQTVHRFDKHFFDHEVVKTGQYRDHLIDEIVDRCFIMFITRYNKGRPRALPEDKEIYVCESRYNEEKLTFNKIKTWASCLPDEVREKDYEMDLYREPKRMKKQPSPIAYLLKDGHKETDEIPKPVWGADNAPPKIGAVHRRPRDPKDSPPPEPTPSPPPQASQSASHTQNNSSLGINPSTNNSTPQSRPNGVGSMTTPGSMNASTPSQLGKMTTSRAPSSVYQPNNNPSSLQRGISNSAIGRSGVGPTWPNTPLAPAAPGSAPAAARPGLTPQGPHATNPSSYSAVANAQANVQAQNRYPPNTTSAAAYANATYQSPQPIEVWKLNDAADASIPPDIRSQFQCDDQGHVLFFTAPAIELPERKKEGPPLGHSVKFLAAKQRREKMIQEKRKRDAEDEEKAAYEARKKMKLEETRAGEVAREVASKAFGMWAKGMVEETEKLFKSVYGAEWKVRMKEDLSAP